MFDHSSTLCMEGLRLEGLHQTRCFMWLRKSARSRIESWETFAPTSVPEETLKRDHKVFFLKKKSFEKHTA